MSKQTKEITIKIEGKEWKEALEKAFQKANKKVKIDGFRPGKAPKDVFLKKYGEQSLYYDAANLCIDSAYMKMVKQCQDLEIVSQPNINVKSVDDKKVEFIFVLTLKPEVTLGKYKELGVKKEKAKVTKEEIKKAIDAMRNKYAENIVKEGTITNGDIAIIDFEGFLDGKSFEGGKGENYSLTIGSNTFIPGFEEQLIGLKKDDKKEVNVTFPKDYHSEDLKGKAVVFKVKVNEIKEVSIPELNKDFFEDLGMKDVTNKEELEAQVSENILTHKENELENKYIDELLEKVREGIKVEIPDVMLEEEKDRMIKQYEENLKMQGISLEQFYQFTNSNEQALKDQMSDEAVKRVSYRLMLEEIAKKEKIEIKEKEIEKETDSLAQKYQMTKDEFLKAFGGTEMVKYDMKMRKAIEIIKGE